MATLYVVLCPFSGCVSVWGVYISKKGRALNEPFPSCSSTKLDSYVYELVSHLCTGRVESGDIIKGRGFWVLVHACLMGESVDTQEYKRERTQEDREKGWWGLIEG